MANYCVVQSGDSNSASTFGTITNTPTIGSGSTTLSTTSVYTQPFTAPSTSDDALGVCLYFDRIGAGTITVQLQEGGLDVATYNITANLADLDDGRWIFFKLGTSYTFTTTGANQYRWKITLTSPTGTTTVADDSGGSNPAYRSIDDRTGVPASGDTMMNVGDSAGTEYTLTMKGTQTIGNDTETYATLASDNDPDRRAIHDFYVADNGTISLDRTAGGDLTIKGCFVPGRGATVDFGSEASPITKANAWTVQIDLNGTTSRYAIYCGNENTGISFQAIGEEIETHTTYVSGTGTLADPMVVASSTFDLQVGDKIAIGGDDYTEFETRTVASVVSSTEYELSSALTYTHVAQTPVIQLTQGLEIKSTTTTEYWFFRHTNDTVDAIKFKNVRISEAGGTLTYSRGIRAASAQGDVMSIDYCSFDNIYNYGIYMVASREDQTFTHNVFYNLVGTQNAGALVASTGVTKEFQDCVFINMERSALQTSGLYASVYRRCKMWNTGIDNNGNTGAGQLVSSGGLSFIDCEAEGSRTHAFVMQNVSNILFQGCSFGSIAANPNAFTTTSGNYNSNILVQDCDFGAGTVFDDYDTQTTGSKLVVANKNGVAFANFTYRPEGISQFCGTGLDDTTTTPLGNRSIRIAPENSSIGMIVETKIPVFVDGSAQLYGKMKINSAFGSDTVDVELYMPESADPLTPDVTKTYSYTDGSWVNFSIAQAYTGTNPGFARVVFRAKSTNSGAYVYIGDFYDATDETNPLASFGAAFEGEMAPVIASTVYDYFGVWAVLISTFTTSGTAGAFMKGLLEEDTYLATK